LITSSPKPPDLIITFVARIELKDGPESLLERRANLPEVTYTSITGELVSRFSGDLVRARRRADRVTTRASREPSHGDPPSASADRSCLRTSPVWRRVSLHDPPLQRLRVRACPSRATSSRLGRREPRGSDVRSTRSQHPDRGSPAAQRRCASRANRPASRDAPLCVNRTSAQRRCPLVATGAPASTTKRPAWSSSSASLSRRDGRRSASSDISGATGSRPALKSSTPERPGGPHGPPRGGAVSARADSASELGPVDERRPLEWSADILVLTSTSARAVLASQAAKRSWTPARADFGSESGHAASRSGRAETEPSARVSPASGRTSSRPDERREPRLAVTAARP